MGSPIDLEQLAQQACALVDPDIKPEDVSVTFGPGYVFGVITCIWKKKVPQTKTFAYFYHPHCCVGLQKDGGLARLCIQTVIGEKFPFISTPNEWYEIIGLADEKPFARRVAL